MFDFDNPGIQDIYENLLDTRDAEFPEYTSRDKSDFGVMLIWLFSVVIYFFSKWIWKMFFNMFLSTSTERKYIIQNVLNKGYYPRGVISSRQLLIFEVTAPVVIPKGFKVETVNGIIFETDTELNCDQAGVFKVYATQGQSKTETFTTSNESMQSFVLGSKNYVEGSIEVQIADDGVYTQTSDFFNHGANDRVFLAYTDELGRGHLIFGNGVNGKMPVENKTVTIAYKVGDGNSGNVEDNAINGLSQSLAGVKTVTNKRVKNTFVTQTFDLSGTELFVKDTSSFTNTGSAFVDGKPFTYNGKTEMSLQNVTISFPVGENAIVSQRENGIIDGYDLESNRELIQNATIYNRSQNRIVSLEDYEIFLLKHPAIVYSKAYRIGSLIRLIAISVTGDNVSTTLKNSLQTEIDKKHLPSQSYIFGTPNFIDIDVIIEVTVNDKYEFDNDIVISDDPKKYVGVKQNVNLRVTEFLTPYQNNKVQNFSVFGLYQALGDVEGIKNLSVLCFDKRTSEVGTISVASGSQTVIGNGTKFLTDYQIGNTIKIFNSSLGNDMFAMVTRIVSDTELEVDTTNFVNETGLYHSFVGVKDLKFYNDEIPRVGEVQITSKFDETSSTDMIG